MPDLPEVVKIGPIRYTVSRDPLISGDGLVRYADASILIKPGLSKDYEAVVLWHEILHAIITDGGLRAFIPEKALEPLMECMSVGLLNVIRDNPRLKEL